MSCLSCYYFCVPSASTMSQLSSMSSYGVPRPLSQIDQRLGSFQDRAGSPAMSMAAASDSAGFSMSDESDYVNYSHGSIRGVGGLGLSIHRDYPRVKLMGLLLWTISDFAPPEYAVNIFQFTS